MRSDELYDLTLEGVKSQDSLQDDVKAGREPVSSPRVECRKPAGYFRQTGTTKHFVPWRRIPISANGDDWPKRQTRDRHLCNIPIKLVTGRLQVLCLISPKNGAHSGKELTGEKLPFAQKGQKVE
jgi:hypothetical protein